MCQSILNSRVKRIFLPVWLVFGWLCVPVLAGSLSPEADESRGVKLSDAMDSAAKGDKEDLGGKSPADEDCDDESDEDADGWLGFLTLLHGANYKETEYVWQMPLDVSYASPFSGNIRGLTHITVSPLSIDGEGGYLGLYVGGAMVDLKPDSLPDRATEDLWMFECGLAFRYYLNGSHTALSPYVTGSLGVQFLNWEYRNPIVAGGDTIDHDGLAGIGGYAGFGVSTKRDSHVSFFAEVDVGATGFVGTTREGFDNDVFDSFGFVAFKLGLTVRF